MKCKICKTNDSTGPKFIETIGTPSNTQIRTLHMCDSCYEAYREGKIELDIKKSPAYKVTLKTGDHAIFPNDNNYDNYEQRLLSGMYGIVSTMTKENIRITPENVLSIEKVEQPIE